jgi:hypothetical protein
MNSVKGQDSHISKRFARDFNAEMQKYRVVRSQGNINEN